MYGTAGSILLTGQDTGTSLVTLVQIDVAANRPIWLDELAMFPDGVNNSHRPILLQLFEQTGGAFTNVGLQPTVKDQRITHTFATTYRTDQTTAPAYDNLIGGGGSFRVHPQSGLLYPFNGKTVIAGGTKLGIAVTAEIARNVELWLDFWE